MTRSISVVIPVYRSRDNLEALYGRLRQVLDLSLLPWEIVLVDDASGDGTFEKMRELHERDHRIKAVRFAHNAGQQHATLCGLVRARGDYVFTLDDDLQNPPEEIPRFIERMNQGYDLVIGRIDGQKQHSWYRNLGSRFVQALVTRILGKPKDIALSSYRCMSRRAVDQITSFTGAHVYLPALMFKSVPVDRICNIAVAHHERSSGRSNYTPRKLLKLASYLLINYSNLPLRVVTVWGFLLSLASLAYAALVAINVLINGSAVSGWPTMVVLVSFLSGNIMLCLGILGEYIGRLVEESSRAARFPVFEELE